MVKVTYSPYREIVIHEIIEQESQVLFEDMVRQALSSPVHAEPTVNWADGVAFVVAPLPPTEDIVKESLEGRLHYASVMYTKIQFQSQIPVKIGTQNYSARLRRADNNPHLAAVAKFLKDFKHE
jgi:hypothetical protein